MTTSEYRLLYVFLTSFCFTHNVICDSHEASVSLTLLLYWTCSKVGGFLLCALVRFSMSFICPRILACPVTKVRGPSFSILQPKILAWLGWRRSSRLLVRRAADGGWGRSGWQSLRSTLNCQTDLTILHCARYDIEANASLRFLGRSHCVDYLNLRVICESTNGCASSCRNEPLISISCNTVAHSK